MEGWALVQGKQGKWKARTPLLPPDLEAPRKTRKGGTDAEPSALPLGVFHPLVPAGEDVGALEGHIAPPWESLHSEAPDGVPPAPLPFEAPVKPEPTITSGAAIFPPPPPIDPGFEVGRVVPAHRVPCRGSAPWLPISVGHGTVSGALPEDGQESVIPTPNALREELRELLEDVRGSRNKPLVVACSVAGASEVPSAFLSRPPRRGSVGHMSSAPCLETDRVVDPLVLVDTQSTIPASLPSPDEAIAALPPSIPQEDFRAHQELLKRVASSLHLQAEELEEPADSLFNVLSSSALGRLALPLHEGVARISNALWQIPASLTPILKTAERKYFVHTKGHEYLYTHSTPNSLVVESVNHREQQGQPAPTLKNKNSRRLDSLGRKVYSSSSFQLRVANHQALLGRYGFNLWGLLPKFEDALQAASDVVDTAARSMASVVSMRRASWLLLSGLSSEAQLVMQDLPFHGKALFVEQMDTQWHGMKDSRTTLQTLGLYVPALAKPKFKPQHAPAQAAQPKHEAAYKIIRGTLSGSQGLPCSLGPPRASRRGKSGFDGTPGGTLTVPKGDSPP
ncbi:hypothetical protein UY3_15587 [Chelonia mydas]|uniref:Lamina-associated polypeptide 2 alpha C-terminal domain-containing protein n=1 Tax=Chelonia mydas TaxID=8469 RepID=M7B5C7_CHEMY|nr:hypothetical protein UY3_15587 [Chelonia mydas]